MTEEESKDELSFDFSKLKKKHKEHHDSGEELTLDLSRLTSWVKDHKQLLVYVVLLLILLMSAWMRFSPEKKYTGVQANSLSAMDPYWYYRHAKEVYEHGYVGTEKVCFNAETGDVLRNGGVDCPSGYKSKAWDFLHDAPYSTEAAQEFYPYLSAYSYKYFGRLLAPNLLVWHRWTPAIFGVLAVLCMFLLVRQLFGEKAGLAAAFMYSLSVTFLVRSIVGFSDTDAPIAFFTLLTFFLFIRAWDRQSFIYATGGGLSLALFGMVWHGYKFAPTLILASVGLYFIYSIALRLILNKEGLLGGIRNHLTANWKKYLVLVIFLVVGLTIIGFARGFYVAKFWEALSVTQLKTEEIKSVVDGEEIRDVFLTVAEMNPPNRGDILSKIHMASILLVISFIAMLPFGLWRKIKENAQHMFFFVIWFAATLFMSFKAVRFIEMLVVPICIFTGVALAFMISRMDSKKPLISVTIGVFIFFTIFIVPNAPAAQGAPAGSSYFKSALLAVQQSGPSLGTNWFDLYDWMRTETPKDAIMASWWDPGHGVTAIGERPVVADGSQNFGHVHDLAVTFTSTNETFSVERLNKYNVSYFFTSTDLISKYGAISFLASGQGENYPVLWLSDAKQTATGTVLIYNLGGASSIIVNMKDTEITASLRQGYQSQKLKKVFYFMNGTGVISETSENNTIDAMLYLDPNFRQAIFLPQHLESNLLTQLHFFNGQNLEHFELVKNFGDEIKVFKVNYD